MPVDDDLRRAVGGRVAEARRERGLTQEQLAERVGKSAKWVQRVESGTENLELDTLSTFANALATTPASLLLPPIVPRVIQAGRPRRAPTPPTVVRASPFAPGSVPFLDLVAAADPAAPLSMPTTTHWVHVTGRRVFKSDFVARVRGTSMEPDVPDGALCLFRQSVPRPSGSVLLVERMGSEGDIGGRFFLKHVRVMASGKVRLVSNDPSVADMVGELAPIGDLRLVAQLIAVLGVPT